MFNKKNHRLIFKIILSVCLIVPLTNDIFISGMPAMAKFFGGANISLVLSSSLLGLAFAQPFYGPLSDRFGRRPVLLGGLWLYVAASIVVIYMNNFTFLIAARFFQAIGACSAIVSVLAIASDTYQREELVKATSMIMGIMGIGPATAPLIGSMLNHCWGWKASFEFLLVLGVFYLMWLTVFFKETVVSKNMEALNFKKLITNYITLARHSEFLTYSVISGFSYGVLFSYIGISSYFIINKMHFSLLSFGGLVALNALPIMSMAALAPHLAKKISLWVTIQCGLVLIALGGIVMVIANLIYAANIYTLMLPMFIVMCGVGLMRPSASAAAMGLVPSKIAGSAAAFFNLFSFIGGTLAISITAKYIHEVLSFGFFTAFMGVVALLILTMPARLFSTKPSIQKY